MRFLDGIRMLRGEGAEERASQTPRQCWWLLQFAVNQVGATNVIANSNGITSTGGGGVNGGAPAITVTVAPASAISITAAASLNGSSTTDGRFFINHVPLPTIVINTITLTVTTADGQSSAHVALRYHRNHPINHFDAA